MLAMLAVSGVTPVPAVQRAKDALIRNQTRILGLVLNKIRARDATYSYGYYGGYGYGGPAAEPNGEPPPAKE